MISAGETPQVESLEMFIPWWVNCSQSPQLRLEVPLFATIELRSVMLGGPPGEVIQPMPGAPSLCATVLLMSTRLPVEAILIPDAGPNPVLPLTVLLTSVTSWPWIAAPE